MSPPDEYTAALDLSPALEADDTQFSSFLAAIDYERSCAIDIFLPDPLLEPFEQHQDDVAPPASNVTPGQYTDAVYAAPYVPDGVAAAQGEGVSSGEDKQGALCSLANLPTAEAAMKDRVRAKNRRNQKAHRDRVRVCSPPIVVLCTQHPGHLPPRILHTICRYLATTSASWSCTTMSVYPLCSAITPHVTGPAGRESGESHSIHVHCGMAYSSFVAQFFV